MNKKIILIPGWMRSVAYYGRSGVDVWKEKKAENIQLEADYVIAHSLGSTIALLNWRKYFRGMLILVNPLLSKRSFFNWVWRWLRFAMTEGPRMDSEIGFSKIFFGLKKFYQLSTVDVRSLLKSIPAEKVVIIRGCNDRFFCTKEDCIFLRENNYNLIEIENTGHHWQSKFNEEIDKIINFE